jgi:colanic acid/amylovoran biosynthesis glycosyltransferase
MLFHPRKFKRIKPLAFPCILFQAASYSEKKGQDVLLKALGHCRNRDRFRLVLNGEIADRDYFNYLKEIISRHDLRNVSLGPKMSPDKYFRMLGESHFICNLSKRSKLHDTEGGIPVLLKDALCASKPVLSSFHCDIPDTIVPGYNGFLFQEGDERAVTSCLDSIAVMSPNEYAGMAFRAGESVRLKLNSGITAGELEEVYRLRI